MASASARRAGWYHVCVMRSSTLFITTLIVIALLALAGPGCTKHTAQTKPGPAPTAQGGLPVIMVDAEHMQVKHADGTAPQEYAIPAGPGFVLDATDYEFQLPPGADYSTPNIIQIVVNKQAYSTVWN